MSTAAAIWAIAGAGAALSSSLPRARELQLVQGLDPTEPLAVSPAARTAGTVVQTVGQAGETVTVTRVS